MVNNLSVFPFCDMVYTPSDPKLLFDFYFMCGLNRCMDNFANTQKNRNQTIILEQRGQGFPWGGGGGYPPFPLTCPLYTSDAADEQRGVDLGGRRIIKKKKKKKKKKTKKKKKKKKKFKTLVKVMTTTVMRHHMDMIEYTT